MRRRPELMQTFAVVTIGLALAIAVLALVLLALEEYRNSNWTETSGVVAINRTALDGQGAGMLAVDYLDFTSGDRFVPAAGCDHLGFGFYTGDCSIDTAYPTFMGRHREDLAVGDSVVVFYDPDDPLRSDLELPQSRWPSIGLTAILIAVYAAAIWYFVSTASQPVSGRRGVSWWVDFSIVAWLVWGGSIVGVYSTESCNWLFGGETCPEVIFMVVAMIAGLSWIISALVALGVMIRQVVGR